MKTCLQFATLFAGALLAVTASAAVHYVDLNSGSPTPPFAGWSTAATNIQDAIDAAVPGDQILVTNGIYQTGARSIDGSTTNRVVIDKAIAVQSVNGPTATLIDGGGTVRCVYLTNGAALVGFTLTNGFTGGNGGGIYCGSTNESVTNCVLVDNIAAGAGGGAFGGNFSGCLVASNTAAVGAGLCLALLSHCVVSNNAAPGFPNEAGGISSCDASDCTICQNQADFWGGGAADSTLTRCALSGNSASYAGGGANNCTLNFCVITTNFCDSYGGGASACSLNSCVLFGNIGGYGGGAYESGVTNCTLVNNVAHFTGGGVASCAAANSIIYDNIRYLYPGNGDENYSDGAFNNCCTWPLPPSDRGNFTNAPIFVNEAAGNLRLQTNSPCINMGDNASVATAVDLDGSPRIYQAVVDMGAYECQFAVRLGAGISAAYTNTAIGFPLSFSGLVMCGIPTNIYWDFGDGNFLTNQVVVSHTWTTAGDYTLTFHAFNDATLDGATATSVIHVIALTVRPSSQTATLGNDATFLVVPGPLQPQSYQWMFNGTNIDSATNAGLTLFDVQPQEAGNYSVVITSPAGYPPAVITTPAASLKVIPAVCTLSPPGLVAWWRLESNSLDEIGTNNGTPQNGTGFVPGKVGMAATFDGSTGFISVPSSPVLKPTTAFTVEAWINYNQFTGPNGATIAMKGPDAEAPGDWALLVSPAQKLRPEVNVNGNWISFDCNSVLNPGGWYHVALVYDGSVLKGYVNGVNDGIQIAPGTLRASDNPLKIGTQTSTNSPPQTSFFSGEIDEVSFYDRALTDSEISTVFNAGTAGKCEAPSAPSFVVQPSSIAVLPGTNVTFSCVAGGTSPLSYQWLVNQSAITNETNSTLTLNDVGYLQNSNLYSVTVSNIAGQASSSNALLTTIDTPPRISSIGTQHVFVNSNTAPISFTISDAESTADQLTVIANSADTNLVPDSQIVLGGSSSNRTVTVFPGANQIGNTMITLTVIDPGGLSNQSSFTLVIDYFAQSTPGIPPVTEGSVAWGDYDNDGHLDLLVSGLTNYLDNSAITRLYHNDGGMFTNYISFPGIYKSSVAWSDYDRDGFLDFAICGETSSNIPVTRIYHNNRDGTFTDISAGLLPVYSGSLAWGDFNNDGAPDLFVTGLAPQNSSKLYRNNGNGTFTDVHANLPGPSSSTAKWGDFDNDGRLDLLLVGLTNAFGLSFPISGIYRNLGDGNFTNFSYLNLVFSSYSFHGGESAVCGDFDNDGWLDCAISSQIGSAVFRNTGTNTFTRTSSFTGPVSISEGDFDNDGFLDLICGTFPSQLYRNKGNGTFAYTSLQIPSTGDGSLAVGDFDNDGRLDFISTGNLATIARNRNVNPDTPPSAPANLAVAVFPTNTVVFNWSPSGPQTGSNGLSYNLRVGTTPGGVDVVPPLADPISGQRRIPALGNAGLTNQATLIDLPAGTYYWSVQAIDNAFVGSPFAAEGSFTITNSRPTISVISDKAIPPGLDLAIPFSIGDRDSDVSNLVVTVRTSNNQIIPLTNIVFMVPDPTEPSNYVAHVIGITNGTSVITMTVTDPQGAFANTIFNVTVSQFSLAPANFVALQNGFVAAGDYDNDGRLDVLIAGNTNYPYNYPVTQLYHNEGAGVFKPVASGLPNVTLGSAAWGDFDNSGNLGLILTGTTNGFGSGVITRIYRNTGGVLTDMGAGLPGVYYSSVAWGDYDNDGRLDVVIMGATNGSTSSAIMKIFRNTGDDTFSNSISLPGCSLGGLALADFDGDGYLDIAVTGFSTVASQTTTIYRNNGGTSFTTLTNFAGFINGSLAVGDFDNDGWPDLAVSGNSTTLIYHNNGNGTFTQLPSSLLGGRFSSLAWGDFDNDGQPDLFICGTSNGIASGAFTRVYHNSGSGVFTNYVTYSGMLQSNLVGGVALGDFDNNGTLDLLYVGAAGGPSSPSPFSQTLLYLNSNLVTNTPPSAPTGLFSTRSNTTVLLSWNKSSDLQTTNSSGLRYQLRIGTTPGGIQIRSPQSDLTTGLRRVVQTSDLFTNAWPAVGFPPGTYYWSVQAIDTADAGSPFAAESTFTVLPAPIAIPDSFATPVNTPISFASSNLVTNDIDFGGLPLTVIAVATNTSAGGQASLVAGMMTYTPPTNFNGNDTFSYSISDGQSATASSTVTATVGTGGVVWLRSISGPAVNNGDFVVRLAGVPGLTYTVEAASNISGPWIKLANFTAPIADQGFGIGGFEVREPMGSNSNRFYRTIYPPY